MGADGEFEASQRDWAFEQMEMELMAHNSNRRAEILRTMATLADELEKMNNRAPEPPEGSVARFDVRFNGGSQVYRYVALRVKNRWYTTSQVGRCVFTWNELLDWLEDKLVGKMAVMAADMWEEKA